MGSTLPPGVRIAVAALVALPVLQHLLELAVAFPIGPSRMVTLALWCVAWVPIAIHALRRVTRAPVSRVAAAVVALLVPLVAFVHILALAGLGDGPFGPVPGGPFHAGASPAPVAWSHAASLRYAEVEVDAAHPRTIETLVLVHDEALFIAANMPEGKRWPRTVRSDGRVRIRLGGERVHALAARFVASDERVAQLREAMQSKYGFDVSLGGPIWFFALERPT